MSARVSEQREASSIRALPTVGVVAVNSLAYVSQLLDNLESGVVSVPLRSAEDTDRLAATATTDIRSPGAGGGWLRRPFTSQGGDDPAQISFTSGTEGSPKAVLLSRENLHYVVSQLIEVMRIDSSIREYIGVPVYHSFGYARARTVLHAGGHAFLPESGFDLREIQRMLKAGEINAISAVPSLWRIFLNNRDLFGSELEAVRWVEIGSQYMSAAEKTALRSALPKAKIVQHYGLTEASRATFLRIQEEPEAALESVGRAEGHTEVRISGEGLIEVRGPQVALGIQKDGTFEALGPDAWLTTSDKGRIDDGLVYYEGRADDIINCGGIKLSPDLMEAHIRRELPEIGDFGLLRERDALRGEAVLLVVTPESIGYQREIIKAISAFGAGVGATINDAVRVREVPELPRTPTGKLQRKKLEQLLEQQVGEPDDRRNDKQSTNDPEGTLKEIFGPRYDPGLSFNDLGGDSLMHMQITLMLERSLGKSPSDWEFRPLGEIVEIVGDKADLPHLASSEGGAPPLPDGSKNMNPKDISFFDLIAEDYRTNDARLFQQGFLMLLIHRFGNLRMDIKIKPVRVVATIIYRTLNRLAQILFGMKFDYTVKVGRRVKLEHFGGMILGAREIGNDVWIRQNTTFGIRSVADRNAKPTIGNNVDIGAGAVIVGNIQIGDNSIIGANTVVFSNVPPNSVVMGVPGRVIGPNRRQNPSPLVTEKV